MKYYSLFSTSLIVALMACQPAEKDHKIESVTAPQIPSYSQTTDIPEGITTPDHVETSIGTLDFFDGVPSKNTAENVYDYLDRMRGVDAFLKGMPGASIRGLIMSPEQLGATKSNQVLITDKLMDSKPLFLTANTSTLYVTPILDLKVDGPTVVEVPPGMLGAFNDAWFRYIADVGPLGEDKGKGGNYLLVPPGYDGNIPTGYFVLYPKTYRVWTFMRGSIANGLDAAVKNVKDHLKIYPLSKKNDPPTMEFISGSGKSFNTIHTNDYSFYEHLNDWIQYESDEMLDIETKGLFASIGIEKGKEFNPDDRMKKILTEAVAIGNTIARSIVWYPRTDGTMKGIEVYPDGDSAWLMGWVNKNVFFTTETGGMNSDARVMFHYPYTAVTPAMAVSVPGQGSDYGIAFVDADKNHFDGSQSYKLHIPADVPVNDFWAITLYDSQTRSLLQTDQPFPTVGSQSEGFIQNEDGSFDVFFAPEAPEGMSGNWLQTIPGKSWFVAFRVYGPLQPWIDKTWRPGEVELIQ